MNKLLYFPYINIPNTSWLIQALLYWDEIASIIPFEYTRRPDRLDSHMQVLLQEGLVKQIHPSEYLYSIENFNDNFLHYIDNNTTIQSMERFVKPSNIDQIIPGTEEIHLEKLYDIGDALVERGFAYKKRHWYVIESNIAHSFMTYLAFVLGGVIGYTPSTDRFSGLDSLLKSESDISSISRAHEKFQRDSNRFNILNKIMPVPSYVEDISDILRFKNIYHEELTRFRNNIEDFLIKLESVPEHHKDESCARFIEESNDDIIKIREKMRIFKGVNISTVTLCSIVSSVIPAATAFQSKDISELYKSIPGVIGAALSTVEKNDQAEQRQKPLAYAAIIQKKFQLQKRNNEI